MLSMAEKLFQVTEWNLKIFVVQMFVLTTSNLGNPQGSPFVFVAEEEGLAKAHGEGLVNGIEGSSSQFYVDARGLVGEPTVQVSAIRFCPLNFHHSI